MLTATCQLASMMIQLAFVLNIYTEELYRYLVETRTEQKIVGTLLKVATVFHTSNSEMLILL